MLAGALPGMAEEPKSDAVKLENAYRGVMQDRTVHTPQQALFVEKCGMCHRQMGMGTLILARRMDPRFAMLETRTDLTAALIGTAVRRGIGNMPRLGRGEVSDAQLAQITTYLMTHGAGDSP